MCSEATKWTFSLFRISGLQRFPVTPCFCGSNSKNLCLSSPPRTYSWEVNHPGQKKKMFIYSYLILKCWCVASLCFCCWSSAKKWVLEGNKHSSFIATGPTLSCRTRLMRACRGAMWDMPAFTRLGNCLWPSLNMSHVSQCSEGASNCSMKGDSWGSFLCVWAVCSREAGRICPEVRGMSVLKLPHVSNLFMLLKAFG